MEITYLGHSCFRIKGKKNIIVTDPFNEDVGFKEAITAHMATQSYLQGRKIVWDPMKNDIIGYIPFIHKKFVNHSCTDIL